MKLTKVFIYSYSSVVNKSGFYYKILYIVVEMTDYYSHAETLAIDFDFDFKSTRRI